jgi:hypothetical protein
LIDRSPSAPFEVTLQDAQRQTVIPTEFSRPQSARFEFNHQSLDLFTTSSLPLSNLPVCRHSHSAPKKPADEQVGLVRRLPWSSLAESRLPFSQERCIER